LSFVSQDGVVYERGNEVFNAGFVTFEIHQHLVDLQVRLVVEELLCLGQHFYDELFGFKFCHFLSESVVLDRYQIVELAEI